MLEMLFNQNRPFKRAPCEFALRIALGVLRCGTSLLLDADKHLREKKALKLLPRLSVFSHSNRAIEA